MANRNQEISFDESLYKLFPPTNPQPIRFNGDHVRDITFQVTEDCNFRCTYCYQHEKKRNSMTFDVGKRFIDMILADDERSNKYMSSKNSRGCILEFIGGEPFLEIELIDQLTDYFIEQVMLLQHPWATRFRISISTNGLLYFDPRVQAYIKKNQENLSLSISVDGDKELHDACRLDMNGHGTYDRAMKAVEHYRDTYGGMVGTKMTIAPGNVDKIYRAVVSMIERGYTHINMNCVYEEGWTAEHGSIMYEQLKMLSDYLIEKDLVNDIYISMLDPLRAGKPLDPEENSNYCGGNGLMIGVDYKGDIYPCLRFMDNAICGKQEPYIVGDVYNGIMATPKQCERVDCLKCITRRSQSTDECFNCPIALGCGACTAYNYEVFGTPDKKATYICDMHKARTLAVSYIWNTWFRKTNQPDRFELHIPRDWALQIVSEEEWERLERLAKGG